MTTTSEIAAAVREGHADMLVLWAAVRRFVHDRAFRWCRALEGRGGCTVDDLMQCAFLALLAALEDWDPSAGSFLTWYGFCLQGAFTEAAGQRTKRERQDPLQWAVSLDMPLVDSEGDALLLEDVVEDPAAEEEFCVVEELDRREAIRRALSHLTADQRTAVVLRHCRGLTLDQTAARMGTTRALARTAEQKGLRRLRHPSISRELRQYA